MRKGRTCALRHALGRRRPTENGIVRYTHTTLCPHHRQAADSFCQKMMYRRATAFTKQEGITEPTIHLLQARAKGTTTTTSGKQTAAHETIEQSLATSTHMPCCPLHPPSQMWSNSSPMHDTFRSITCIRGRFDPSPATNNGGQQQTFTAPRVNGNGPGSPRVDFCAEYEESRGRGSTQDPAGTKR